MKLSITPIQPPAYEPERIPLPITNAWEVLDVEKEDAPRVIGYAFTTLFHGVSYSRIVTKLADVYDEQLPSSTSSKFTHKNVGRAISLLMAQDEG